MFQASAWTHETKATHHPYHTSLIFKLQQIQRQHGYLPEEELEKMSKEAAVPLVDLYSLATFYKSFNLSKPGKHHVCVCSGTACHVRGSQRVFEEITAQVGLDGQEGTTPDGLYTVKKVNCLGACASAPLVTVDGNYHGQVTPKKAQEVVSQVDPAGNPAGNPARDKEGESVEKVEAGLSR